MTWIERIGQSAVFRVLGLVGVVTAIPLSVISLPPVQNQLFDSAPAMEIGLVNEVPIFDVKQPLSNLKVMFNGSDLTALKQSLVSSRVRISNVGDKSLTPSEASPSDPLGFRVIGGKILRTSRSQASSDHLRKLSSPRTAENVVTINPELIFDSRDFVEFELIILKDNATPLRYLPVGKVSKQPKILFSDYRTNTGERSFISDIFGGSFLVQLARTPAYAVIFLIISAIFIYIYYVIYNFIIGRRSAYLMSVAKDAYEHLSTHNRIAVAFCTGMFAALGYKATRAQLNIFRRELDIDENLNSFKDSYDDGDIVVHAKMAEVRDYLKKGWTSPYRVSDLAREFGLVGFDGVSPELISTLEELLLFAEKNPKSIKIVPLEMPYSENFDEDKYFAGEERRKERAARRRARSGVAADASTN